MHVGEIRHEPNGGTRFVVSDSYVELGAARPTLSLAWHDLRGENETVDRLRFTGDKIGSLRRLPDWFSGLLPEGALRELVNSELGAGNFGDFEVLKRLGQDLPGAVRAGIPGEHIDHPSSGRIRFSLAGVQLKFVGDVGKEGRITFPASGRGGHYIVKTPSDKYPNFVEAEVLAMRLAAAVGIDVAETTLVSKTEVEGIPERYLQGGENVLVSRRFDRRDGGRVHIEDFAQIASAAGDLKYTRGGYDVVKRVVARFSTDRQTDVDEVVRRTVNDVLVGNGDAHLKNWSFVLDGTERRLSPAYDILPYRAYGDDQLAGPIAGAKKIDDIPLARFMRFLGDDEKALVVAKETVERAVEHWPALVKESEVAETVGKSIMDRLHRLEFAKELLAASPRSPRS